MQIDLSLGWPEDAPPPWAERLEAFLAWCWPRLNVDQVDLGVIFCTEADMADLNGRYRGLPEPTDVLSFGRGGEPAPGVLEGDLALCPDYVARTSREFGVGFEEELLRVTVHGLLHLLGWDHETNDPEEPMLRYQEELLREYFHG